MATTVLGEGSGNEATIKVLRRRGGKVWLAPRNGNGEHEDIVVDGEQVLVHGTVQ